MGTLKLAQSSNLLAFYIQIDQNNGKRAENGNFQLSRTLGHPNITGSDCLDILQTKYFCLGAVHILRHHKMAFFGPPPPLNHPPSSFEVPPPSPLQ